MNAVPENMEDMKKLDSYEFFTSDEDELVSEVEKMEANSRWIPDVVANNIRLEPVEGPTIALSLSASRGMDYELLFDTSSEGGSKLVLNYGAKAWPVRDTARSTLSETARLNGAALGDMLKKRPLVLADTLNNGLMFARRKALLLERYGKISAIHSNAKGGYCPMPISELIKITKKEVGARFGEVEFKNAGNRHDYTYAIWELPDAQDAILDIYKGAMANAVSHLHAVNFVPAVRLSSSDTATSSAILKPMFKLKSGVYFSLFDGIKVEHTKSTRSGQKDGVALFEEEAGKIFALFSKSGEAVKTMAETGVMNPVNTLIGFCNAVHIPAKYAEAAREEVELFALNLGGRPMSVHDIFLSMAEIVGNAKSLNASASVIANLEEKVARVLTLEWEHYDVGGVVSWAVQTK